MALEPKVGDTVYLPAGHGYLQPAQVATVTAVKPGEWVAYEGDYSKGCSRYDYFQRGAQPTLWFWQ